MQDRQYTLGEYIDAAENFDMKPYKCTHFVGFEAVVIT